MSQQTPTTEARACQCCGQAVTVYTADEGTQSYVGVERAALLAQIEKAVLGLSRQMQYADPFFPDTYDYETVGLNAVIAAIRSAAPVEPT